jgi:hypothetical protein
VSLLALALALLLLLLLLQWHTSFNTSQCASWRHRYTEAAAQQSPD